MRIVCYYPVHIPPLYNVWYLFSLMYISGGEQTEGCMHECKPTELCWGWKTAVGRNQQTHDLKQTGTCLSWWLIFTSHLEVWDFACCYNYLEPSIVDTFPFMLTHLCTCLWSFCCLFKTEPDLSLWLLVTLTNHCDSSFLCVIYC